MKTALSIRPAATAALTLALLAGLSAVSAADLDANGARTTRPHLVVDGNLIDVQVKVEGKSAPLYFRPGSWDRHYFEALKGRNYSVVIRNNSGRRVGVLLAVDGLNVVNGERTSLSRHEPMYVLDAYESAEIRGWRTSLDEVRRFVFVNEERSYAERTGQANGDLGWIRVLSFREVEPLGWFRGKETRERDLDDQRAGSDEAPGARNEAKARRDAVGESEMRAEGAMPMAPEANPGTGWGSRSNDRVERTEFRAAAQATDHLVLRYEYESGLRALGIHPQGSRLWDREQGQLGFAKPPRW
jgi:hypothetical protein